MVKSVHRALGLFFFDALKCSLFRGIWGKKSDGCSLWLMALRRRRKEGGGAFGASGMVSIPAAHRA